MGYSASKPLHLIASFSTLLFLWGTGSSFANAQTFQHLCIDGIEGDSTVSGYEGCILLTTFQQTLIPANKSKYTCRAVVKKNIGIDSPAILARIATNQLFPSVVVSFASGASAGDEYFRIELTDVRGESVIVTGASDGEVGETLDLEEITFVPATISITYTQADGGEPQQAAAFVQCGG